MKAARRSRQKRLDLISELDSSISRVLTKLDGLDGRVGNVEDFLSLSGINSKERADCLKEKGSTRILSQPVGGVLNYSDSLTNTAMATNDQETRLLEAGVRDKVYEEEEAEIDELLRRCLGDV